MLGVTMRAVCTYDCVCMFASQEYVCSTVVCRHVCVCACVQACVHVCVHVCANL